MVYGFEDLEVGGDAVAFFVEDQGPVFHASCDEEADVALPREFLRGAARGGVVAEVVVGGRLREGAPCDGDDGVEVVGHEGFVREDEEEGEFFEDSDLGDAGTVEDAVPAAGVVGRGDIDAVVGADGEHRVVVWLVEGGGAVDVCSANGGGFCVVDELGFDFSDGTIEGRAFDSDGSGGRGQCLVGESGVCDDS